MITLSQSEASEAENVGIRCQVVRAGPLCLKRPIQAGDQFADGKDPKIGVKLFNVLWDNKVKQTDERLWRTIVILNII